MLVLLVLMRLVLMRLLCRRRLLSPATSPAPAPRRRRAAVEAADVVVVLPKRPPAPCRPPFSVVGGLLIGEEEVDWGAAISERGGERLSPAQQTPFEPVDETFCPTALDAPSVATRQARAHAHRVEVTTMPRLEGEGLGQKASTFVCVDRGSRHAPTRTGPLRARARERGWEDPGPDHTTRARVCRLRGTTTTTRSAHAGGESREGMREKRGETKESKRGRLGSRRRWRRWWWVDREGGGGACLWVEAFGE